MQKITYKTTIISTGLILLFVLLLSACTGKVNVKNPTLASASDIDVAKVYFIRPRMLKPKGYSDGTLDINLNGNKLLELHAGAYTLLKLKPGKARVSTHSLTNFTNKQMPIKVSRFRDYNFIAGKTYFIEIYRIDEEFRGVFFDPRPVNLAEAQGLLDSVTAFGLAKYEPLEDLKAADLDMESSDLPPAFPESLYPEEPYVLEKSPFK